MKRKVILNLQLACKNLDNIPDKSTFIRWIQCIFLPFKKKIELTIRIVDKIESRALNMYFLKKNFPTDVLSFPFSPPLWMNISLIGDLVICQEIIEYKAQLNSISIETQLAYTVIHGTLHLIGYDHTSNNDAKIMENLEKKILNKLGYINISFL